MNQTYVLPGLKRKFYPRYTGFYRIIDETSPVNYIIEDIKSKTLLLIHANQLKPAIARMEFESPDEELNSTSTQPDPDSNRSPEPEIDPWDELIFSSLGSEPTSTCESGETAITTGTQPQSSHSYALRSRGAVKEEPWISNMITRSRIPHRIKI